MFTRYTAAVTAVLTLGIAGLAQGQSTSNPTRSDSARARDQRQLATDTMKLRIDKARLDSLRTVLDTDRAQARADKTQLDSLEGLLKQDRQKGNTAAIASDKAAVIAMRKKLDAMQDRGNRVERRVDLAQKLVDREREKSFRVRKDIKQDRSQSSTGNKDQRALATDTMKLRLDKARLDSTRALLNQDRTLAQTDKKQVDSLEAALKQDRQRGDTAAVARDRAAVIALRKKLEAVLDRANREERRVDLAQNAVKREREKTFDVRQDLRADRSGAKHAR